MGKVKSSLVFHFFSASGNNSSATGCKNRPFTDANQPVLSAKWLVFENMELTHSALLRYSQECGKDTALAKPECKELHFTHNGKSNFAIGFPNVAGGYEVRNRFFKGCIAPKDISHIRQHGKMSGVRRHGGLSLFPHVEDEELSDHA